MVDFLLVFLGAGLGGMVRYAITVASGRWFGPDFPWGTAFINVSGGLIMGMAAAFLAVRAQAGWSPGLRLFAMTGVLGGYTTFSAFSLDAVFLWERGASGAAFAYVGGSVALSILALLAGLSIVRAWS